MRQQEPLGYPDEPAWPRRRETARPLMRSIAACGLTLMLGLGHAYADPLENPRGAREHDKGQQSALATAEASAGTGDGRVFSFGQAARSSGGFGHRNAKRGQGPVTVAIDVEEEGIGTNDWTRTVTRNYIRERFVISITDSTSVAFDDDGNKAIAKAVARAVARNNVRAVQNGAGSVVARTSVDVTGNGIASADAGGSIGVSGGGVTVSTWGKTSAEVF